MMVIWYDLLYEYSNNGYGCSMPNMNVSEPNSTVCCAPGPYYPQSNDLYNVMILGDSVSIGYTYEVVTNLSSTK